MIEAVIKNSPNKEKVNSIKSLKNLTQKLLRLFHRAKKKGIPAGRYEASSALIPKQDDGTIKKETTDL